MRGWGPLALVTRPDEQCCATATRPAGAASAARITKPWRQNAVRCEQLRAPSSIHVSCAAERRSFGTPCTPDLRGAIDEFLSSAYTPQSCVDQPFGRLHGALSGHRAAPMSSASPGSLMLPAHCPSPASAEAASRSAVPLVAHAEANANADEIMTPQAEAGATAEAEADAQAEAPAEVLEVEQRGGAEAAAFEAQAEAEAQAQVDVQAEPEAQVDVQADPEAPATEGSPQAHPSVAEGEAEEAAQLAAAEERPGRPTVAALLPPTKDAAASVTIVQPANPASFAWRAGKWAAGALVAGTWVLAALVVAANRYPGYEDSWAVGGAYATS